MGGKAGPHGLEEPEEEDLPDWVQVLVLSTSGQAGVYFGLRCLGFRLGLQVAGPVHCGGGDW